MKSALGFLADLLIVFIGVFAAFQLNDYQTSRKAIDAKVNYYKTFKQELEQIGRHTRYLKDTIDKIIDHYEVEIEAGNQPKLKVHRELLFRSKALVVESAFNDEHFSTIGQEFIVSISRGTNFFYWIDLHLNEYKSRTRDLLYNQPFEPERFYKNNQLKPEFQWYLEDLKMISRLLEQLIISIERGAIPQTDSLIEESK